MPEHISEYVSQAAKYWQSGQTIEAGRLIHDHLRPRDRPAWAAKILLLVLDKNGADRSHFHQILETAENPQWWAKGQGCFDLLRNETLKYDDLRRKGKLTKEQDVYARLLLLAEFVAKVTYNASDPKDEFDEDSGWWIAVVLNGFVKMWGDAEFSKAAWSALCDKL
jgi:hypothetical protein